MSEIVSVTGAEFSGSASHDNGAIQAWMKGNADYAALDAIEMLLSRTHSEARRLGATELVLDVRDLEFMNSSCLRSVVNWLSDIQELDESRRYRVKLVSSSKRHWQKRSLHTLRAFAADLITIQEH